MSSHLFLTAPNPQIMQATSQRAPRIVISCNSPSSETSPQSVNCGAKRPKTTIRSAGDAICASESAIDAPEIAVDGECALLRLSAASSTTTTTSTTGTELPTVELAADVQRVIRYGMQLHQSASLHHAAHCFDLVRRRAAAPAERAFAAVNSIALLSKKARPISPELLEAADRDLQLAFLDVDSLSGEFSELFFFFPISISSLTSVSTFAEFHRFLAAEAMVCVAVTHADAYANVGDVDLAASLAEQCLAVLAQHALAEEHVKPLYWRLAVWHRRAQRPAVAAVFEARDAALGDNCGSALTIPSPGRAISPMRKNGGAKFVPIASVADEKAATHMPARVLCRPTAKRSALAAFPCLSTSPSPCSPTATTPTTSQAPTDEVLNLLPVLSAVIVGGCSNQE
jgi:hypothetical protein